MRTRTVGGIVAVALLVGALVGMLVTGRAQDTPSPAVSSPPVSSPPLSSPAATGFGATDVAWIQLMIAMNERALRLLDLVPERTKDARVAAVAARIGATHRAELGDLRALLHRAGLPQTNVHEGHEMPGMVTATKLDGIARTADAAFVRRFTTTIRDHLTQCAHLSGSEQDAGSDTATKALAASIERARATELEQLAGLAG